MQLKIDFLIFVWLSVRPEKPYRLLLFIHQPTGKLVTDIVFSKLPPLFETGFHYSPVSPRTHYVGKAGFELTQIYPPLPTLSAVIERHVHNIWPKPILLLKPTSAV